MIVAELAARLGLISDEGSWARGHQLIEGLKTALTVYLGAEGIEMLKGLVESTVSAGVEAKHLGERLSLSTEAVQELGYAADVSGSSAQEMQASLQHLTRSMQEVHKGSGAAVDGLKKLGISTNDADIKGGKLDDQLMRIAEGFANAGPSVNKTAVAMELFGSRSGTRLLPLLNKGRAGIMELRQEAERLGVVMGDEAVEKAEEFEVSQKKLKATLTGLRNEAVVTLLPALNELVDSMTEWVSENHEAIASTLEEVMHGVATAFKAVGTVVSWVTGLVEDHGDAVTSVVEGLAVLLGAFAIEAAIDWAIAFWPVALAIIVIAAIILVVKDLWTSITEGKGVSADVWRWVTAKAEEFADWFKALPGRVEDWANDVADSIRQAFSDAWDYVVNKAHESWEEIKDIPIIGKIAEIQKGTYDAYGKIAGYFGSSSPELGDQPSAQQVIQTFGATSVTVTGANMSPEEIQDTIAEKIRVAHSDVMRQAYESFKGSK